MENFQILIITKNAFKKNSTISNENGKNSFPLILKSENSVNYNENGKNSVDPKIITNITEFREI